jgi:hypothetical protein
MESGKSQENQISSPWRPSLVGESIPHFLSPNLSVPSFRLSFSKDFGGLR